MKLFVSGIYTASDRTFETTIDSTIAIKLINSVKNSNDNIDDNENILHDLHPNSIEAQVLDSFSWFVEHADEMIAMLSTGQRFALIVEHIVFGVSGKSFEDAKESMDNQEF